MVEFSVKCVLIFSTAKRCSNCQYIQKWKRTPLSAQPVKRHSRPKPNMHVMCVQSNPCNLLFGWRSELKPISIFQRCPLGPEQGRNPNEDEEKCPGAQPQLFNIANIGLSLMTRSGQLQIAGDCSINLLGTERSSLHNLKGFVFGIKLYPVRWKEVHAN